MQIVATCPLPPSARQAAADALQAYGPVSWIADQPATERIAQLAAAEVVVAWNPAREASPEEWRSLGQARLLQLISAGADHVPLAAIPPHVPVAANVGAFAEPMAEHILALVLALAKQLRPQHRKLAAGQFDQWTLTRRLRGSTCAVLGYGGIGRAAARLLRPFGVRILAINRSGRTDDTVDFIGTLADLEPVLRQAHIVVVTLPLTRATRGLLGARELEWLPTDAILVNVARGAIIDEAALFRHLQAHPEFFAGIDTWWHEPFRHGEFRMDFPFLDLPNVIGSPHNSAMVPGVLEDAARAAAANIVRLLQGQPPQGLIDRADYADDDAAAS